MSMVRGSAIAVTICVSILAASTALAQFPGGGGGPIGSGSRGARLGGGGGRGRESAPDPGRNFTPSAAQASLTPHGGEFLVTQANYYEVVYMPLQTRIYLFDKKMQPLSARDVHAQMSLTLPKESSPRKVAFQYVAHPAGKGEQDYVVAELDIRPIERETPISFELTGLPDRQRPTASYTPLFTPAKVRPYVARVQVTQADNDAIARQRACPVSGQALSPNRQIVKLYIADFALYVFDEDCVSAVEKSPEKYLWRPVGGEARQ
jgi:hypothetical protein